MIQRTCIYKMLISGFFLFRDMWTSYTVKSSSAYTNMSAGPFLRSFRRAFKVKKAMALRKAVQTRRERLEEKRSKVNISQIEADGSTGKQISHCQLQALIGKIELEGLKRLYTRAELIKLCEAYDVTLGVRSNKKTILEALLSKISRSHSMPNFHVFVNYSVGRITCDSGRISLLLTRTR